MVYRNVVCLISVGTCHFVMIALFYKSKLLLYKCSGIVWISFDYNYKRITEHRKSTGAFGTYKITNKFIYKYRFLWKF